MKKVLSAALALGMVAGVASTASAAFDNFRVKGYYDLEGLSLSNTTEDSGVNLGTKGTDVSKSTASWYQQNFRIYPVIEVNDKIKMAAEVRLMDDDVWGTDTNNAPDDNTGDTRDVDINKLYMEWTTGIGVLRMGRVPFGAYGPDFINASTRADAFVYFSNLLPKPWSAILVAGKAAENDASDQDVEDGDTDYYDARIYYKTDMIDAGTRVGLMQDRTTSHLKADQYRWDGYGNIKFMQNYFVEFEWEKTFGDMDYDKANGSQDIDYDALAAMVKVGGNFGALDASLTYWYVSGDDDQTDKDNEAFGSSRKDFTPLMIMTGADTSLLNNDESGGYYGTMSIGDQHGANGLVLSFGYKVNDKLSLSSALGTAWAAEDQYKNTAGNKIKRDDDYGFEIDLGMEYKLLDNLTYRANFGYWDAGDFFVDGYKLNGSTQAGSKTEEDNVIMLTHGLNMTF